MSRSRFCIAGRRGESWVAGPFDTIDQAREELTGYDDDGYAVYYIRTLSADEYAPSVEDIAEWASDKFYDDTAYDDTDPVEILDTDESRAELRAWFSKYAVLPFSEVIGAKAEAENKDAARLLEEGWCPGDEVVER